MCGSHFNLTDYVRVRCSYLNRDSLMPASESKIWRVCRLVSRTPISAFRETNVRKGIPLLALTGSFCHPPLPPTSESMRRQATEKITTKIQIM